LKRRSTTGYEGEIGGLHRTKKTDVGETPPENASHRGGQNKRSQKHKEEPGPRRDVLGLNMFDRAKEEENGEGKQGGIQARPKKDGGQTDVPGAAAALESYGGKKHY